jgi:DNA-binding PadR family transcriptional regulator
MSYFRCDVVAERTLFVRNLWALTVLCFLRERPLHPYQIRQLVVERSKDQFLDLIRGSLYHAVNQLQRAGLIEAIETLRQGRRPERTVYNLTGVGERELLAWLADLLRRPTDNMQEFFAALSFLAHLPPNDVASLLEQRAEQLKRRIGDLDQSLKVLSPKLGRVLLLESEFAHAAQVSELAWVRSLIEDIQSGKVTWEPVQTCAEQAGSRPHSRKKG